MAETKSTTLTARIHPEVKEKLRSAAEQARVLRRRVIEPKTSRPVEKLSYGKDHERKQQPT